MKDPLLILALSFGMGHLTAAESVAEAWEKRVGEKAIVWDAIPRFPLWFRAVYVAPFWAMLRYCPGLWRRFFERRLAKIHRHTIPPWILRRGTRQLLAQIRSLQPRLILATEVGACEIASLYKQAVDNKVRIAALLTDYQAEPAWIQPGIDLYFAPSSEIASQLRQWSRESLLIELSEMPIRAGFTAPVSRAAARRALGMRDRPTILMMAGGMGPSRLDSALDELLNTHDVSLQVIAIAGKDAALLARLRESSPGTAGLTILSWTDEVQRYMAAADVLITKPGALTLSEAFAMKLPTVLLDPLHRHEEKNAGEAVKRGFAVLAQTPADAARLALGVVKGEIQLRPAHGVSESAADRIGDSLGRLAGEIERLAAFKESPVKNRA